MSRRNRPFALPRLVRFLDLHALLGVAVGICVAAALLVNDTAGIGTLFARSGSILVAGVLYFGGFAVTFGMGAIGTAVLLLPED
jgi:hypothetical protein